MFALNSILELKKLTGVEVHSSGDAAVFRAVGLRKQGKEIVVDFKQEFSTLDHLAAELPKAIPLVLVFSGKGVLTRKVHISSSEKQAFQSVFPSANPDEFEIEYCEGLMEFTRISVIEETTEKLTELGFRILEKSLPLSVGYQSIKAFTLDQWSNSEYKLSLTDQLELNDSPSEFSEVASEKIESRFTSAFSAALVNLLGLMPRSAVNNTWEEEKYRKLFRLVGTAALVVLFITLAANVYFNQHYQQQFNLLQLESQSYDEIFSQLDDTRAQVESKRVLVQKTGLNHLPRNTEFSDRIAASVLPGIKLEQMHLSPLKKKLRTDKPIEIGFSGIHISGMANDSGDLNSWMNLLENLEFVNNIKLVSYERTGKSRGLFELTIEVS